MVLPTGSISFSQINSEIQNPETANLSLNDGRVRTVAGKPSGTISMNDLRGKSYFRIDGGNTSATGGGSRLGQGSVTATTPVVSGGTITGGQAPFSYYWDYVSGDTVGITARTSLTTAFSQTEFVSTGQSISRTGNYRCRVTDATGAVVYGPVCEVFLVFSETS